MTRSTPDGTVPEKGELPAFDLEFWFDDPKRPGEVTIFDPVADDTTTWLTADASHAVPIDRVA